MNEAVNRLGRTGFFPNGVTLALLARAVNDLAVTLKVPTDPGEAAEIT